MRRVGLLAGALLAALGACASAGAVTLEPIGSATYSAPTYVTSDPRDPDRLFVTEQPGSIDVTTPGGTSLFLDLTDKVLDGGERGLWSMALAPDFAQTGRFYVAYSANDGAITLDEYREQATPAATEATRREVLAIANEFATDNHNGGQLQFGPDGYLYWSVGEDAFAANAEQLDNLLGKILRIDPRGAGPGQYTVPADNPFVGVAGAQPEIWIYGLRNPWRFSFDRLTGEMYIGDVGAGTWEEVSRATRGANLGWPTCEAACSPPQAGLTDPIYYYSNPPAGPAAITGGYVVRDAYLGDLYGRYLFVDYYNDVLRSIDPASPPSPDGARDEGLVVNASSSLGQDACGRHYVVSQNTGGSGQVFRLEGTPAGVCPPPLPSPPPPMGDADAPETTIDIRRLGDRAVKVTLGSDEAGSTFECKLDRREWKPCEAKRRLRGLDPGRHRIRGRATDAAGNVDGSPAKRRFKARR